MHENVSVVAKYETTVVCPVYSLVLDYNHNMELSQLSQYSDLDTGCASKNCACIPEGQDIFSSPNYPDQLWGPLSLLFTGFRGALKWGQAVVSPMRNWLRCEVNHSPSSAEVENEMSYSSVTEEILLQATILMGFYAASCGLSELDISMERSAFEAENRHILSGQDVTIIVNFNVG